VAAQLHSVLHRLGGFVAALRLGCQGAVAGLPALGGAGELGRQLSVGDRRVAGQVVERGRRAGVAEVLGGDVERRPGARLQQLAGELLGGGMGVGGGPLAGQCLGLSGGDWSTRAAAWSSSRAGRPAQSRRGCTP
jgi:hypothetical protein